MCGVLAAAPPSPSTRQVLRLLLARVGRHHQNSDARCFLHGRYSSASHREVLLPEFCCPASRVNGSQWQRCSRPGIPAEDLPFSSRTGRFVRMIPWANRCTLCVFRPPSNPASPASQPSLAIGSFCPRLPISISMWSATFLFGLCLEAVLGSLVCPSLPCSQGVFTITALPPSNGASTWFP